MLFYGVALGLGVAMVAYACRDMHRLPEVRPPVHEARVRLLATGLVYAEGSHDDHGGGNAPRHDARA